ncbi:MAG: HD domain-containing protein, partial [Glaciecola sp.]|nr:HD domain-containing protein [Glaciecola sp.]
MVTIRTVHQPQRPSFDKWLAGLAVSDATREKLASISDQPELLLIGQEMVEILHELNMDDETLQAALVFPYCEMHTLSDVDIETEFGRPIADLVNGVRQMDAIKALHAKHQHDEQQVDNIRKMLISMVADVRAVVIKMAERICTLQQVKEADEETRVLVARECSAIYAPLANRLGIG